MERQKSGTNKKYSIKEKERIVLEYLNGNQGLHYYEKNIIKGYQVKGVGARKEYVTTFEESKK